MTKYVLNGKMLRNLRAQNEMSQKQLAESVGFTGPSSMLRIEKGERTVDYGKLVQIANVFGVDPQSLILEEIEDNGALPTNYTAILRALNTPVPDHFSVSEEISIKDILKRVEKLEKEKPIAKPDDELSAEERELIKMFRASSEPQRKAALAAAKAILNETL